MAESAWDYCIWCRKIAVGLALAYAPDHYRGPYIQEPVCSTHLWEDCYRTPVAPAGGPDDASA